MDETFQDGRRQEMKKICKVCGKTFSAFDKAKKSRSGAKVKPRRPHRAMTCSKKCARSPVLRHKKMRGKGK